MEKVLVLKKILIVTEYFYPEEFKINEVAQEFSKLAKMNLDKDLSILKKEISSVLKNIFKLKALPIKNKYARLVNFYIK